MKKSIILAGAVALAFSFNACQKDNGEQAKKDWAAIDSIAGMKSTAFTDSLNNACMMNACKEGMMMGDSMVNASKKGKGGKKTTTTTVTPPPPPVDPKKDKMGGNNTNTDTKKDKMGGDQKSTTDAKKDKMGGKPK